MSGWGEPVVGYTALRNPAITSPNFNLANPTASPSPSWGILQSGLAYFFGLVLSGGTITGPDYIINTAGIFIYSGTPASGNLIGSWAGAAGTDAFGNAYPAGFLSTTGIIGSDGIVIYYGTGPALGNIFMAASPTAYTDSAGNVIDAGFTIFPSPTPGVQQIGGLQVSTNTASGFNGIEWDNGVGSPGEAGFFTAADASNNPFSVFQVNVGNSDGGSSDDQAIMFAESGNSAATTTPAWVFTSTNGDSTTFTDNFQVTSVENIGVSSTSPEYLTYGAGSTQQSVTFTSGSGHWVAPTGVTAVTVQCWGSGGGGAGGANASSGGGEGGGGGAYASSVVSVTAGNSYPYSVGAGGAGGAVNNLGSNGHDTTFNTSTVVAKAGLAATLGSVGLGGTAAASTGNSKHNGGNGGTASSTGGSGGGGSAGSNGGGGAGGNSTTSTGGTGGAAGSGQGSAGGAGGNTGVAGKSGTIPGSGGGGGGDGSSPKAGGSGGNGRIILTWTAANNTSLIVTQAGNAGTDGAGNAFAKGLTGPISAFTPGSSPTTVETWHTATLTNSGDWTTVVALQYKLNPDNSVSLIGELNSTGIIATSRALATLPANYRPLNNARLTATYNTGTSTVGAVLITLNSSGNLVTVPSIPASSTLNIECRFRTDA